MSADDDAGAPKRSRRGPVLVGVGATLLLVALGVAAWVRGSFPDDAPRDPSGVDDGIVCQLLETDAGHRPARCAMIIEAPVDEVSAVVRDYERFGETFDSGLGTIEMTTIDHEDAATVHLEGEVDTVLFGEWDIDVRVHHEDAPDGTRTASWEQTDEDGGLNRGRWVVRPVPQGSLLVYEIEIDSPYAPRFLVNDVLLTQLAYPLQRVADRVGAAG